MSSRQIIAALIATTLIMVGLIVWQFTRSTNCWDNYQTEQQAIQHCENK